MSISRVIYGFIYFYLWKLVLGGGYIYIHMYILSTPTLGNDPNLTNTFQTH